MNIDAQSKQSGALHMGYVRLLLAYLKDIEVDTVALYGQNELAALARLDPNARFPMAQWQAMMDIADAHFPDRVTAFRLAEFMHPMDTGAIGFIAMACANLREATDAMAQFFPLLSNTYRLKVELIDDRLVTRMLPLQDERVRQFELLTQSTFCWHSRSLARRSDLRFDACLTSDAPPERLQQDYLRTFGGQVQFNADEATVTQQPGAQSLIVSRGDHGVQDALRAELMARLATLESDASSNLMHRVEGLIKAKLDGGEVRIEEVAAAMSISVRTLQMRMDALGFTFRELLDRTRHALALGYLADDSIPLTQIAVMLGFGSQSSFIRAFQRWTGLSPGDYRRSRLQAGTRRSSGS